MGKLRWVNFEKEIRAGRLGIQLEHPKDFLPTTPTTKVKWAAAAHFGDLELCGIVFDYISAAQD